MSGPAGITLKEGRFARFEAIRWWDQSLLARAKVLVVGAGALGNEVIKNLSLLGVGHLVVVDMDVIEESNLCRSVLFRAADEGRSKAETAARAARRLYPQGQVAAIAGNLLADVGLGVFRWADVVVGALDNREARVFVNSACAQTGRSWIDGGIDVLSGIVRGFSPPATACYECTMGQADWDLLAKRRSCSLLARKAFAEGGAPTTPTTASVIGAMQAQEVVKRLHGLSCLDGAGYVFEGLMHQSYRVEYPVSGECPWHEGAAQVCGDGSWDRRTRLSRLAGWARERLGGLDAIDLSREIVEAMECSACGVREAVYSAAEALSAESLVCGRCGRERAPVFFHSVAGDSELMERTPEQLGLPLWDIVWARRGEDTIGMELAGDSARVLRGVGRRPVGRKRS